MGQPKTKFKLNMMYVVPVLVIIGFIALCYVGSLLLMHLNGLPLDKAGPFTAFRYFPIYKNSPVKSVRLTVIFCAAFPFLVSAGIAVLFTSPNSSLVRCMVMLVLPLTWRLKKQDL